MLLVVLDQAAQAGDQSGNLLGIAAIITAVGTIIAAVLTYLSRRGPSDSDADLRAEAARRVERLNEDILDLMEQLRRCRSERQTLEAEGRVKDMEIGSLQGRLADCRRERERLQEQLRD